MRHKKSREAKKQEIQKDDAIRALKVQSQKDEKRESVKNRVRSRERERERGRDGR